MVADVVIWEIDRSNQLNMVPVYIDRCGRYSNETVDSKMIQALVCQFAHCPEAATVSCFNCGGSDTTWAFASDGTTGHYLFLIRVIVKEC